MREEKHQRDSGQVKNYSQRNGGAQQRHRRNRCHFVAAQNIFLALLHRAHARAVESAADNADRRHHCDYEHTCASLFRMKRPTEEKEEHQREEIIEEEHGPISHRELEIDFEEGEERVH